jgi:hypothetical protein
MSLGLLIYYIKNLKNIFKNEPEVFLVLQFLYSNLTNCRIENLKPTLDKIKIIIA